MRARKRRVLQSDTKSSIVRLRSLYSTLVSDIMDEMGLRGYVLDLRIRPIYPNIKIAGEALTATAVKYKEYTPKEFVDWASVMLKFLTAGEPGTMYVVHCEGADSVATWGEIMSKSPRSRGAIGAITDGAVRDTPRIYKIRPPFQVFAKNITPLDAKRRIEYRKYDVAITCGGVNINPGDFVLADNDGIVTLPRGDAEEIISRCEERLSIEKKVGAMVSKRNDSIFDAVSKYRIF